MKLNIDINRLIKITRLFIIIPVFIDLLALHVGCYLNVNRLHPDQTTTDTDNSIEMEHMHHHFHNSHHLVRRETISSDDDSRLRDDNREPLQITSNFTLEQITSKLLEGYEKYHRPGHLGEPTVVKINMYVQRFGSINVIDMDYSIDIYLRQKWVEPRLRYQGYNKTLSLSYLKHKLWIPDLFFRNSKYGFLHDITTPNNLIWLYPNGSLTFSQKITVQLSCPMKLWNFPMDIQVCPLELGSYGFPIDELVFIWMHEGSSVTLNKNLVLNEFETPEVTTGNCSKAYNSTGTFTCLYVHFRMERKYGFYLIYTYLPAILIVTISWISFWIDYKAVPARITLGLLSVLALMTQSAATVQKLPRVSYIKAIDVWLFACLAFVVASLLEFALVNMIARRIEQKKLRNDLRGLMMKEMQVLRGNFGRNLTKKENNTNNSNNQEDENIDSGDSETNHHLLTEKKMTKQFKADKVDTIFVFLYPSAFILFNLIYWIRYLMHREYAYADSV